MLISLDDETFNEISMKTTDGAIITGDPWFDKLEQELLESG
jgi:homoserine trans-succinylase